MAKTKQISNTLNLWQAEFGDFIKWKNFLIKRHGPLIFGICLDKRRDPNEYMPIFFIHNILRGDKHLSLTYATTATSNYNNKMILKFEADIASAVLSIKENTPILEKKNISFGDFLSHISLSISNNPAFGRPHLPTLIADIIITGCYVGCETYFLSTLPAAKIKIHDDRNINLDIIHSVEQWALTTKEKALSANSARVLAIANRIGLPELKDEVLLRDKCEVDYLSWL